MIKYDKIPKISPRAYIFQRPFLRGLICLEGLIWYYLKFKLIKCRGMKIFEWIKLLRRHLRQIQGNWGGRNFKLPHVWLHGSLRMQECRDESEIYIYKRIQLLNNKEGCVRLGNPDLDFEIGISDFAIEREIRKQISLPRNPSSWWVLIKKSKSGFHGFPFYRSI